MNVTYVTLMLLYSKHYGEYFRNISYASVTYVTFACFHCLYDCSICNDLHAYFVWMDDCQCHLFSICHVLLVTKSDIVTFIICSILKRYGFAWMDVRIIVFVWWMTVCIMCHIWNFCMFMSLLALLNEWLSVSCSLGDKSNIVTFIICSILKRYGFAWIDIRIIVFEWWMTVCIMCYINNFCMFTLCWHYWMNGCLYHCSICNILMMM